MRILGLDPGNEQSAWVTYDPDAHRVISFGKVPNDEMMRRLHRGLNPHYDADAVVIEQIASYGMAVGAEVFETVFWSGRFAGACEVSGVPWYRIKRMDVKLRLCHHPRANDSNVRQALLDLWGGKAKAIGKKATPGPLYGIVGDCWQAMAVAVAYAGQLQPSRA